MVGSGMEGGVGPALGFSAVSIMIRATLILIIIGIATPVILTTIIDYKDYFEAFSFVMNMNCAMGPHNEEISAYY